MNDKYFNMFDNHIDWISHEKFWIELYNYYASKGYYMILATFILNILLVQFFIVFGFSVVWFMLGTFYWKEYLIVVSIHLFIFILKDINRIITSNKFYNYLRKNDLLHLEWNNLVDQIIKLSFPDYSQEDVNRLLYGRFEIVSKILELTILKYFWTKVVYQQLNIAILSQISSGTSKSIIRKRSIFFGILFLMLSPLFLIIILLYAILKYGIAARFYPNLLKLKDWSFLAKVKYRKEDEPYWTTTERLQSISSVIDKYLVATQSDIYTLTMRFVSLIISPIIGTLTGWTIIQPEIIYEYKYLLATIAALGTILVIAQISIPRNHKKYDVKRLEEKITEHIELHDIEYCYMYRPMIFVMEIISVFVSPLLLIFYFPSKIEEMEQSQIINNNSLLLSKNNFV